MVFQDAQLIFHAVAAQQLLYGGAWVLAAVMLPTQRRTALHWALFCLCSALALGLMLTRPQWPLAVGVGLSSFLLVLAAVAVRRGAEHFFDLPAADREHGVALALMAGVLVLAGPGPAGNPWRVPLLTLLIGGVLLRAVQRVHPRLRAEFGPWVAWALHLPVLTVALAAVARSVWVLGQLPQDMNIDPQLHEMPGLGLAMLLALAAAHFGFGGLLVGRMARRLVHLSRHDALTNLLNRRAMLDGLQLEWQRWRRQGGAFHLLMLDLDHFKTVNDGHGHAAGDAALRAVAAVLRGALRPMDLAARMGGEEFLVLLPGADADAAEHVAQRLCELIAAQHLPCALGRFSITASIGMAGVRPEDPTAEAVMERADKALYAAKYAGRDRVMRAAA